jgi:hypothetical protein
LLWGGLAGKTWSESKLKELGEVELEGTTTSISSSYAGQFGGPTKRRRKQKLADINLQEGKGLEGVCWEGYEAYGLKDDGSPNCVPVKLQVESPNLDVFGYPTKHFEICPGAQALFQNLVSIPPTEDTIGMIRSMAQIADNVFAIEKDVLEKEKATPEQLKTVAVLVEDFYDVLEEVQEEIMEESGTSMDLNADFMYNHLDLIAKYVA